MQTFYVGQRWISDNDAALGLGIVKSTDIRRVTIEFPASGETRTYASNNAPLTRVTFDCGDTIESIDGWKLTIDDIEEVEGTLRYHGQNESGTAASLHECELSDDISFNLPQDKLLAGQIDDNKWFSLRANALRYLAQQHLSPTYGLQGARVSLIPHQLYIASEVTNRIAPRVLLADEVGLGKTIEAGLILHRLIVTGKIERALIVVPEPLLHQWLVELLRRFNLRFTLLNENAFAPGEEDDETFTGIAADENPFDNHSLVLCGLNLLCREDVAPLAASCGWDMLIVDEAHHLQWSPEKSSQEYHQIEILADIAEGVLLLTATPEQLGAEGHFARLRLLDPARFHSLEHFLQEEQKHTETAKLVNAIIDQQAVTDKHLKQLKNQFSIDDSLDAKALNATGKSGKAARQKLIDELIDQHGTGRILFRNTRANISGFPQRIFIPTELNDDQEITRITWLAGTLRDIAPDKALLICSSAETASHLAKQLANKHGLQASVFHEHMSIVERDRAAAWFADAQDGARLLICSEIGSEGRNFQFLHNIILFDLPENPDLLEQRIGRLDRIGQQHDIYIRVPTAINTREHRLSQWYHHALNAFEKSCITGQYVKATVGSRFDDYLDGQIDSNSFIQECLELHTNKTTELDQGRNRLLELNACRSEVAEPLIDNIYNSEKNSSLSDFLEHAFDCFGVEIEDHSLNSWIIRPGDHLQVEQFPELPEDGMTITTHRETALAREDMHFFSWEHPTVRATLDLILNGDKGAVSVCALKIPQLPARSILLEAIFEAHCPAPEWLGIDRYLPRNALRLLIDQKGRNFAKQLPQEDYDNLLENVDRDTALQMIDMTRDTLKQQIKVIESGAEQYQPALRDNAIQVMHQQLDSELQRLIALKKRNPAIRDEEISQLEKQIQVLDIKLASSTLKLSALRVIYTH